MTPNQLLELTLDSCAHSLPQAHPPAYHDVIAIFLSQVRTRKWWASIGHFAFNEKFALEVDRMLENTEPSTYLMD